MSSPLPGTAAASTGETAPPWAFHPRAERRPGDALVVAAGRARERRDPCCERAVGPPGEGHSVAGHRLGGPARREQRVAELARWPRRRPARSGAPLPSTPRPLRASPAVASTSPRRRRPSSPRRRPLHAAPERALRPVGVAVEQRQLGADHLERGRRLLRGPGRDHGPLRPGHVEAPQERRDLRERPRPGRAPERLGEQGGARPAEQEVAAERHLRGAAASPISSARSWRRPVTWGSPGARRRA